MKEIYKHSYETQMTSRNFISWKKLKYGQQIKRGGRNCKPDTGKIDVPSFFVEDIIGDNNTVVVILKISA